MTTTTNTDTAATDTGTAAEVLDLVTLSRRGVARLVELLDHCHSFLDTHPTARAELGKYCTHQPAAVTPFWVIDQLGWHALLLRLQLVEQAEEDRHG